MRILAVSTSAKRPSAAIYIEENGESRMLFNIDESSRPHSVSLCALVDETLRSAGCDISDMDALAVDVGPGSFTGVRIGVSFINALAFSANKPVFAISSLAALRNASSCDEGTLCVMLDARNDNCYAALYENGSCVLEPSALTQQGILGSLPEDATIIGDIGKICEYPCECDAALVIKEALRAGNCRVKTAVPLYLRPSQAERMRREAP